MKILNYLKHGNKLLYKRNIMPEYVTFFATNRCNCRCRHCFYWKELNNIKDELTLDEIENMSKSMGKFLFLLITGGEPFIRNDIADIVKIFYRNNRMKKVSLMTNGYFSDKIINTVKKISESCRDLDIGIYLSLDGIGEEHDRIRGINGMYKKTLETFYELKKLKNSCPNLNIIIVTTYSSYNQDRISGIYNFVKDELKPDSINVPLVRGDPLDKSAKDVDLSNYESLMNTLKRDFISGKIKGLSNDMISRFVLASKFIATDIVIKTSKEDRFQTPCFAGTINAVIYPSGDVYPCEMLDRNMGNLRDYSMNFKKLWSSKNAKSVRDYIKSSKCFCVHMCNLLPNVVFNPGYIPGICLNMIRLGVRR